MFLEGARLEKTGKKLVMVIYVTVGKGKKIKRSVLDLKETLTYWCEAGSLVRRMQVNCEILLR